jgi:cell division protein FtsN
VHAIYIASDLYLKEDSVSVFVANRVVAEKKEYHVLVGPFKDQKEAASMKDHYERKGFMRVSIYRP